MNKLKNWVEEKHTTLYFAGLLNGFVFIILLLLMSPVFETNDDTSMMMFVNYSSGYSSARLVFINYLMGLLYKGLYFMGHGLIPWYALIQYLLLFLSFTAITWVLLQKFQKISHSLPLILLLQTFFGYECYIKIQFTKTASILIVAGVFLMFYALTQEIICKKLVAFGMVLGVFGGLYRFEEAMCCAALMSGIGVYLILTLTEIPKEFRIKKLLTYLLPFACLLTFLVSAELFDQYMYASDPEWAAYTKLNNLRCELMDFGIPSYDEHKEEYDALGINEETLKVMKSCYCYYDPDIITVDVLEKIVAMKEKKAWNKQLLADFFSTYPIGFFSIRSYYCFLFLVFGWLFWKKKGWKPIIIAFYEFLIMGCLDLYMFYTGRYLMNRVEMGLWLAISLVVIWLYDQGRILFEKNGLYAFVFLAMLMNQEQWCENWRINPKVIQTKKDMLYRQECQKDATQETDSLYMASVGSLTYSSYGPFDSVPEGVFENVIWYGGWEIGNPNWVHTMAKFDVISPYGDIIDKNVYVADIHPKISLKYIKKNHQENVVQKVVKEYSYFTLYQYVSE